ncbi:threonylcarbamoyladenosine tRNA methylthiotransferase-like [Labrus bergylta]|uniref:threonylcarbamoyladenosine tRNA methylthiotransferase-like n=1 Tax=Labrus bergylta TaxID=56723 RepID=UPI0033137DBD
MPSACDSLIEDIEDMVSSNDPTPHERQSARKSIIPRSRKKKDLPSTEELQVDSFIPGTQKIWMKTWGCSHNNSDGEYMAGQLAASGYKMTAFHKLSVVGSNTQAHGYMHIPECVKFIDNPRLSTWQADGSSNLPDRHCLLISDLI